MHYSKLFLLTQACHAACYHGSVFVVKLVLRRSATSVGAVSTLFLRNRPHFDLYRANSSRSSKTSNVRSHCSPKPAVKQQCTTKNCFYALYYSKLFLRTQACHAACYHGPVFVVKWVLRRSAASAGEVSTLFLRLRPHLDLFPLGVHSATIRIAHLFSPIPFFL